MKKTKKLVVGNWKMNPPSVREARKIGVEVKRGILNARNTEVVIAPPYIYMSTVSNLSTKTLHIGAQDAFYEPFGSYTGEVSFSFLPEFKVGYVILGHSERRKMGESDEVVNKKVRAVLGEDMTAILCVGESARDTEGNYLELVRGQISAGLRDVSKKTLDHVVVAYEPVWAIGATQAMQPRDVLEMSIYIKKVLRDMYGVLGDGVRILYGGSVTGENARDIVDDGHVQGLLVGRQSLKPKDFVAIIKAVDGI